jgi:hypothetical protein
MIDQQARTNKPAVNPGDAKNSTSNNFTIEKKTNNT